MIITMMMMIMILSLTISMIVSGPFDNVFFYVYFPPNHNYLNSCRWINVYIFMLNVNISVYCNKERKKEKKTVFFFPPPSFDLYQFSLYSEY